MIALRKKQVSGRSYEWRPNFRDYDSLPDIRAVRAKFFLPTLFIALAVGFLSYTLFREYSAMQLREDIAELTATIAESEAKHNEKVAMNSEFMAVMRQIDEVNGFVSGQLVGSDFLLAVSSRVLPGMFLTRVEYSPEMAMVEGSLEVQAEEASRIVDRFMKSLQEADVLQGLLTEYKLTMLERDQSGKGFKFRIQVEPKPNPKGKAKK